MRNAVLILAVAMATSVHAAKCRNQGKILYTQDQYCPAGYTDITSGSGGSVSTIGKSANVQQLEQQFLDSRASDNRQYQVQIAQQQQQAYAAAAYQRSQCQNGSDWLFQFGGRQIYRKVLSALLGHLGRANADDWSDLLRLPRVATEWLPNHQLRLESAVDHYKTVGVCEDRDNCCDISELEELRRGLKDLSERHGIDFVMEIDRIDTEIAEREEHEPSPKYETGGYSGRPSSERAETVTEHEVRDMFRTLRG